MEDLNGFVDEMLNEHRPRGLYEAKDHGWRQPVYDAVASLIPAAETRRIAAEQIVDRRETTATRLANNLLRQIGSSGQVPLDWLDVAAHPISVGDNRVRLADAEAADFRQWAIDERRDASQDFTARSMSCDGAEIVAAAMDANGWARFGDALA